MPLRFTQALGKGLDHVAECVHNDGALGVLLALLISCLVGLIGLFVGGVYLESTKEPDTVVHVKDLLMYWVYTSSGVGAVIFFNTAWYCFKQEQHELIDLLKDSKNEKH
jgi:hypothetical protein